MKRPLVTGLLGLLLLGLAGRLVAATVPVHHLVATMALGLAIGNLYGVPDWARPAVGTHTLWLELGIVLTGASVALDRVVAAGPTLLLLVVATVATTVVTVELLARFVFAVRAETGSLLAAGSGVCGVSAVVAVAESIDASETRIAYAAATILLFDAVTLFVYPAIGHALGLSDTVFGIWAGLTMFSTGPVTAAGFAFSNAAGQWALLVKLVRNALIGLVAVGYAIYYARDAVDADANAATTDGGTAGSGVGWRTLWATFPKFVLGFLLVMAVANLGALNGAQLTSLSHLSEWAFLVAFAGLGLDIRLDDLRETGYAPVLVVVTALVAVATVMLVVVECLF
jgi:uncharacterized integral membrane protein (TIGR00698 family)